MGNVVCNDHIFIIGFMGAGKTSVSRMLSSITGLSLIDVDRRIVAIEHRSIPTIFEQEGEEGFRRIETRVLKGIEREGRSIVSCGGGVVCNPANVAVLRELGTTIYLRVGLDEAISRISRPETRPMLSGPTPVEDIYNARLPLYEDAADIVIDSSGLAVRSVARLCKEQLKERGLL